MFTCHSRIVCCMLRLLCAGIYIMQCNNQSYTDLGRPYHFSPTSICTDTLNKADPLFQESGVLYQGTLQQECKDGHLLSEVVCFLYADLI